MCYQWGSHEDCHHSASYTSNSWCQTMLLWSCRRIGSEPMTTAALSLKICPNQEWKRLPGRPWATWLRTVEKDLALLHLGFMRSGGVLRTSTSGAASWTWLNAARMHTTDGDDDALRVPEFRQINIIIARITARFGQYWLQKSFSDRGNVSCVDSGLRFCSFPGGWSDGSNALWLATLHGKIFSLSGCFYLSVTSTTQNWYITIVFPTTIFGNYS